MYKTILKPNQNSLDFSLIEIKNKRVDARGLHQFLEIKKDFSDWIKNQIKRLDLEEGIDYHLKGEPHKNNLKEYFLELEIAKEVSMVSLTKNGKKARKYFIECEKKLKEKSTRLTTLDILELATGEIKKLKAQKELLEKETATLATRDLKVKTKKEYQWKRDVIQKDRGRSINYFVFEKFLNRIPKTFFNNDSVEISYPEGARRAMAHNLAKKTYKEKTGFDLPKASLMSLEQKKDYLDFLSRL